MALSKAQEAFVSETEEGTQAKLHTMETPIQSMILVKYIVEYGEGFRKVAYFPDREDAELFWNIKNSGL